MSSRAAGAEKEQEATTEDSPEPEAQQLVSVRREDSGLGKERRRPEKGKPRGTPEGCSHDSPLFQDTSVPL
ncbi:hypothetical protein PFLUV_G00114560 [Perca fluviatilis]|uniref:Uncharacterized protein n=1 Tax=Perca fluviatilis TaxID=8168 RepID=A0A6A5FD30_PERFL|nr:hypothetical protein PFLUV_G00114560 [Perca fluviatilis]